MKKFNKMEKWLLSVLGAFVGFGIICGLSVNLITTCADSIDASAEIVENLDDSATDEEVIDGVENGENDSVLDKEKDETNATIDEIKNYIDNLKDENGKLNVKNVVVTLLTDAKFWIIMVVKDLGIAGALSLVFAFIDRKHKRNNTLTASQIESIATAAANKTIEKVVGKSIDVDISAEVSKAVKQELSALNNSVASLADGVKNAEMLSAEVAMAQSRSRLLTDEERIALREAAAKVQEHAGKKVISAPKLKIKAKTEKTETPTVAEDVEKKNMYFIKIDGVEKK